MEERKVPKDVIGIGAIIENPEEDMKKVEELLKKAEELDKKYIDQQVKIKTADKQAEDI